LELEPFDLQRVYKLLAHLTFERKLDGKARVSLGRQLYPLGAKLVRERELTTVRARFDPNTEEWVFLTRDEKEEIVRRPLKGLDVQTLTGLDPSDFLPASVVQLSLPFFDLRQEARLLLDS
jgi:hypothetical protein